METATVAALAGMLLVAAGTLLSMLDRSCDQSPGRINRRLGYVFGFFGGAVGLAGLVCLVSAKEWLSTIYAFAVSLAVTCYMRGTLFRVDRPTLIVGVFLAIAIVVNVSLLIVLWR